MKKLRLCLPTWTFESVIFVVKYAKRGLDGRERIREKVIQIKIGDPKIYGPSWQWQDAFTYAQLGRKPGERIVAIIEGGYH